MSRPVPAPRTSAPGPRPSAEQRADVEVRGFEPGDRAAWDELVRRARVPHPMLERDYVEYHADRFSDSSLLVFEEGALCAAVPASRDGDHVTSHGGLTFGGLVSDRRASASRTLAWMEAIVAKLRDDGVGRLTWKPAPHIYHAVPAEEELYALTRLGARLVARDLSAAIALDRRLPYAKGRKAAVKRGRELHVAREHDFGPFWQVEQAVLAERHGRAPVHTAAEIGALAEAFPDGIALHTARSEPGGELLGGVVVYRTPVVMHAQYIAATAAGLAAGAVDAIVDRLLAEHCDGLRWFDFGISTLDGGAVLNQGLARNKESFGARGVVYDRYELLLADAPVA